MNALRIAVFLACSLIYWVLLCHRHSAALAECLRESSTRLECFDKIIFTGSFRLSIASSFCSILFHFSYCFYSHILSLSLSLPLRRGGNENGAHHVAALAFYYYYISYAIDCTKTGTFYRFIVWLLQTEKIKVATVQFFVVFSWNESSSNLLFSAVVVMACHGN